MRDLLKIVGPFEGSALRTLNAIPGLRAEADSVAWLQLEGKKIPIDIEFKRRVGSGEAWQLIGRHVDQAPKHVLIVAEQISQSARHLLEQHGLNFVDGQGNCHLKMPGIFVHIEKPVNEPRYSQKTRLVGKAAVAAEVLLLKPHQQWRVQDLAEAAAVSLGQAHLVVERLEREGILSAGGTGPTKLRTLTDPTALLDLLLEEAKDMRVRQLRTFRLGRSVQQLTSHIARDLELGNIKYAITAAAAANLVAPFVTAVPVIEIWVPTYLVLEDVAKASQCEVVETGSNVVFMQARDDSPLILSERRNGLWLANPVRILRDLKRDPRRGQELAEHFRREVLGF